jgi:RNA polymerase sigma-70 factor (ECF subfamily)
MSIDDNEWLATRFDESRAHLQAVAYRMLGSTSEAQDAVQEAWLKLSRANAREVANFGGWLTTIVARVCLDMLRTRRSRREQPLDPASDTRSGHGFEDCVALADATGPALVVVLEMLEPAERVAFVLHDMFDLSFDEIAPIVDRTPTAARQLASRARRRVQGATAQPADMARQRELVDAFLAASRVGDFERLLAVLSPDVVLRADDLAVRTAAARQRQGAPALAKKVHGASRVADVFKGRAAAAMPALVDAVPGAAWAVGGHVRAAFAFSFAAGKIARIDIIMNPEHLAELDVQIG